MLTQIDICKLPSYELGMEQGMEQGIEQGLEKGLMRGREEGKAREHASRLNIANNLLGSLPDEEIARIVDLPVHQIQQLKARKADG